MRPTQDIEYEALVDDILESKTFKGKEKSKTILAYLFQRRYVRGGTDRETIAFEALKDEPRSPKDDPTKRVATSTHELREHLAEYAVGEGVDQKWVCDLLPGKRHVLNFRFNPRRPSERFWSVHLAPPLDILIVHDDLLFFVDLLGKRAFRFFDTNVDDIDKAKQELVARHPEMLKVQRCTSCGTPIPNVMGTKLRAAYAYDGAGQMVAVDLVTDWFGERYVKATKIASRNINRRRVLELSSILIGHTRTNPFIRRLLDAAECEHLRCRFDLEKFGRVEIKGNLKAWGVADEDRLDAFVQRESQKGLILGPTKGDEWLGIVTRIPNPSGHGGGVTIIASDVEFVIRQIAASLVNDDKINDIFRQVSWPMDRSIPTTFEMLFAVKLAPGGMIDEAATAELLAWSSNLTLTHPS